MPTIDTPRKSTANMRPHARHVHQGFKGKRGRMAGATLPPMRNLRAGGNLSTLGLGQVTKTLEIPPPIGDVNFGHACAA